MSGSDFVKIPREWIEKLKKADGNEAFDLVEQLQSGQVCETEVLSAGSTPDIDPEILPTLIEAIRCTGEAEMHGETSHVEFQKNPELMDALFTVADWLSTLQTQTFTSSSE